MIIISLLNKFIGPQLNSSYILICKSLSHLLKAEKVLQVGGIDIDMIPVPRGFGSPCKTALVFPAGQKETVQQLIEKNNIAWQGIYNMSPPNRKLDWSAVFQFQLSNELAVILKRASRDEQLTMDEILKLLNITDKQELAALFKAADLVRRECVGDRVDIRGAIEFSNYCRRNCCYCGLRRDNKKLPRYRMTPEEILNTVSRVAKMGLRTVILQSGEDSWYTTEMIVELIRQIKSQFGLRITLSLGEREPYELELFRAAGANNYLLKIETADRGLFANIHPDDNFEERFNILLAIKKAGFLVGSGNIVGLPSQQMGHLAEDVIFLKEKGIHMIGTGPFIPATGTPYEKMPAGSVDLTVKMIAVLRLVCQNVYIPATTALATLDSDGLAKGLKAGANTIMLINTPSQYRQKYNIYNAKKPVGLEEAVQAIKASGRQLPIYLQ